MQQGLLFHGLLARGDEAYIPQIVLNLSGEIDSNALSAAWQASVDRFDVLRTGVFWEERDEPFQVVYRDTVFPFVHLNWSDTENADVSERVDAILAANRQTGFDLRKPPLARAHLITCKNDEHLVVFCYHHLILDGWSAGLLLKNVFGEYFAITSGKTFDKITLPRYADFIAWLGRRDKTAALRFWKQSLALPSDCLAPASLPPQESDDSRKATSRAQIDGTLSVDETNALRAFARAEGVTLNTLVQCAFAIALTRYGGSRSAIFGVTVSGRAANLPQANAFVGLLINTIPVLATIEAGVSVRSFIHRHQAQQAAAAEHDSIALADIQRELNGGNALFESLLVMESYPTSTELFGGSTELALRDVRFDEWTHLPLTTLVGEGDTLRVSMKYLTQRLDKNYIDGLMKTMLFALRQFPHAANETVHRLWQTDVNALARFTTWNATIADIPDLPDLITAFEQQVSLNGNAIALIDNQSKLTYAELNRQSNQVAAELIANGIGTEDRVAIYIDRSTTMVIGVLAALKAGAAYVPLDTSYPVPRLEYIVTDAAPTAVIIDSHNDIALFPQLEDYPLIDVTSCEGSTDNIKRNLDPTAAIYVIYTSGSTGQPKGVINAQRALINRLNWMRQHYQVGPNDKILHKTPLGFDVSAWELFLPLISGATMVIAEAGRHGDAGYLCQLIAQENVTMLHFVPPMLAAFLEAPDVEKCLSLKHIVCSGEALPSTSVVRAATSLPNAAVHNLYGPTEAAIDVSSWQCDARRDQPVVPIGRPIDNIALHILDDNFDPVPLGAPGELFIGGLGLARGYLNRPALTAERFVPDPFSTDDENNTVPSCGVLYCTGDRARFRTDGVIEYLGRFDNQVKIRGVRIELGEIENALSTHNTVNACVAMCLPRDPLDPVIHAYFTSNEESSEELLADLMDHLRGVLPAAMLPSTITKLDEIPLTPNGKANRAALPIPEQQQEVVPLQSSTEKRLATIWQQILACPTVSREGNFFSYGGHSLAATRVVSRLRRELNVEVPLRSIFDYPSLVALAEHIDTIIADNADSASTANIRELDLG